MSDDLNVGLLIQPVNSRDWDRYEAGAFDRAPDVPDAHVWDDIKHIGLLAEPLGFDTLWITEHHRTDTFSYRGTDQEADVSYAFGYLGDLMIQFIVQHDDTPSIYRDMYAAGEEGFHHVATLVHDFPAERQRLLDAGFDLACELHADGVDAAYFDTRSVTGCFTEIHGDRTFADDPAIICGLASFRGRNVAIIGHQKGRDTKEKVLRNFAMPRPEGYRKALRAMRMAEKFKRPIVVFVDTPAAYPGIESEERGIAEAIALNLREMAMIDVPIIVNVCGHHPVPSTESDRAMHSSSILRIRLRALYTVFTGRPNSRAAVLNVTRLSL